MKNRNIKFSFVIPVYNRPDEVQELLESMVKQTVKGFEVVIVEDGSSVKCDHICDAFKSQLELTYYFKPNSGPGQSRNYGSERAAGDYVVFLDSDCVLPPTYFEIVQSELANNYVDAYGGPDRAHKDFTLLQKAINYSMTSFFTTGGIRGSSEKLEKFHPRSFNMGYSRTVFETTKGFSKMRFGEDIDMSIRILSNGFTTSLFRKAYVYHKRRTSFKQFYKQVYNSGIARINLFKRHPKTLKLVHFAPATFTVGVVVLLLGAVLLSKWLLLPIASHALLLFVDASIKNKSIAIGGLAVVTSYIQLLGYGTGFINAAWKRIVFSEEEYAAYVDTFYD